MADEIEPRLKADKLNQQFTIWSSCTALCASDKVILIGTEDGNVHVIDYSGDEVRPPAARASQRLEEVVARCAPSPQICTLQHHTGRVTDIQLDESRDFGASCSVDGVAAVFSLYDRTAPVQRQARGGLGRPGPRF